MVTDTSDSEVDYLRILILDLRHIVAQVVPGLAVLLTLSLPAIVEGITIDGQTTTDRSGEPSAVLAPPVSAK